MPDYTKWPTLSDVQDVLDSVNVAARNDRRALPILNDVIREVERRTRTKFIPDATDTTRVYDGSGTSEMEIDPFVSFTGLTVSGLSDAPGYAIDNIHVISEQGKPQTRLAVAVGSLAGYTSLGLLLPYRACFPQGRQNIIVTARFGWGATIPEDLWNAVAEEVAYRLIRESIYNPLGQLVERMAGDEREKYASNSVDLTGYHARFETLINSTYKRSQGRRLRNLFPQMY